MSTAYVSLLPALYKLCYCFMQMLWTDYKVFLDIHLNKIMKKRFPGQKKFENRISKSSHSTTP